jgi:hypothetical protein
MGEWRYSSTILVLGTILSGHVRVPATLLPGKEPTGTHCTGGWVGSRVGMDAVQKRKILQRRESNPGR